MFFLLQPRGRWMSDVGEALHDAREIYRAYSRGGEPAAAELDEPVPAPDPPLPREDPDVFLDVSSLKVDEIDLELDARKARVALDAEILDLLKLNVGVDAELGRVNLQIKGVEANALLKVRLHNLTVIIDRVMSTIDDNPELLQRLVDRVGGTLDELGAGGGALAGGAGRALGELASNAHPDPGATA
jgi:hypothetical protein